MMSGTKDLYMDAHEAAAEAYMDANPDADPADAYEWADGVAEGRMADMMADRVDAARDIMKERGL